MVKIKIRIKYACCTDLLAFFPWPNYVYLLTGNPVADNQQIKSNQAVRGRAGTGSQSHLLR